VLGMALGYGLLQGMEGWLIRTLGLAEYFRFRFYPMAAGYTTLLCVGVTVFSLVEPARLSAQVSPLDALRGKLAKELTVGKALMLLAHKLSGGRSKRRERKSLAELVFGAPGFYAHRNATRRGGAGAAVFLAMLFSSAFLMTILSFSDSYTATLRQQIGGFSTPYREKLYYQTGAEQLSVYDAGRDEELREKLMAMKDVQDCFWLMERDSYLNQYSLLRYDPGLKALYAEGAVDTVVELGFTKEDMEKERPYLAEGELDYERMLSEGGVLLCDHSPAQKEGERQSSYRIGDKIRSLSIEGAAEAKKVYLAAVAVVSERHGLDAWVDAEHRIVSFSEGEMQYREREGISSAENPLSTRTRQADDTEFDRLEEELLNELEAAGYACAAYMPEKSLRMTDVLDAVKQCVFERGEVDTYTIQGILSEEICTGDSVEAFRPSGEKQYAYIRLVFPMEAMTEQYRRIAQAEGMSGQTVRYSMLDYRTYGGAFALSLAVDRPAEMLNERLRGLAERNGMWYTNLFEEKGQDYFALANYLNVIKVACTLIGGFILLICLVQIINTLQADMRLRRKEMWLYDVVGMDPKQKALMLLLEHGFGAVTALLLGMLVSMVFSYLFIKKLLDVNGEYVWSWPVLPALLLFFGISGILLAVNAAELRKS
ncbi:MAG: ABC transporter permease, partial [Lachnospiraceae bacterium]|nr:ABC transporter permease [Lachnospiraceae bacterium]